MLISIEFIRSLDHSLSLWINSFAGRFIGLDVLGIFCADFLIFVIPLIIILFYFISRRDHFISILLKIILAMALAYLISHLLNYVLGVFFIRRRPFVVYSEIYQLSKFWAPPQDFSFPSDHTATAFVMGLVVFANWRKLGSILLVIASILGLARVFIGVHYPLDILGGVLTAFLSVWLMNVIFRKIKNPEKLRIHIKG